MKTSKQTKKKKQQQQTKNNKKRYSCLVYFEYVHKIKYINKI